jgi:signal transduction histidine kinase
MNLNPGEYVFHVKAANSEGIWNEPGTSLKVIIHPPFWETWWFVCAGIIFIVVVVYGIFCYRIAQSLKLERLRNKIAADLHDEVGASLTCLSIYSSMLDNGIDKNELRKYLQSISDLSREVVGTMSDIVWSVDVRDDSMGDLIIRMKDFATDVLASKNIAVVFTVSGIDESKLLDPVLKQNLYLIFKESMNNIIKHAEASKIEIQLINNRRAFSMKIRDNGKGFSVGYSEKGNGVRNMLKRAAVINAGFKIQSDSTGTTIYLSRKKISKARFSWRWVSKSSSIVLFSRIINKLKKAVQFS